MNRRLMFILAALVMAVAYLSGALAPPLHSMASAPSAITVPQWVALEQSVSLLLGQELHQLYLPMVVR